MNKFNPVKYHDIMIIIKELLEEAYEMLPAGEISDQAYAFWYSNILKSIDDDHDFEDCCPQVTMHDSLNKVKSIEVGMQDNPADKERGFPDD